MCGHLQLEITKISLPFLSSVSLFDPNQTDIFVLSEERCAEISFAVACSHIGSALGRLDMKQKE